MSRAFVDDDAGSDETADMHEIPLPLPSGAKNYMTPEGAMRMSDELRHLLEIERPRASAGLAAAEPSAKSASIRQISEIDRRVSYLSRMKSILVVVDPPESLDRMVFGLVAKVTEERFDPSASRLYVESKYRIVGVDESDPERGWISWASPIAKALIGKRPGESALVKLPAGELKLTVLGISRA